MQVHHGQLHSWWVGRTRVGGDFVRPLPRALLQIGRVCSVLERRLGAVFAYFLHVALLSPCSQHCGGKRGQDQRRDEDYGYSLSSFLLVFAFAVVYIQLFLRNRSQELGLLDVVEFDVHYNAHHCDNYHDNSF